MPPTPSQANLEGLSEGQRIEELKSQLAEAELEIQLGHLRQQRTERENKRLRDAAATAADAAAAA
jgi:hypothetical protein